MTTSNLKPFLFNDGIQTATLKEVGIDETVINTMTDSISNGIYTNVHSVLISRDNKLVYEQYWPGEDEVRMKGKVGNVPHHRDSLHDVRSITKSITSAAVMIALAQGKIKSLQQKVFDFFPEYSKYKTGRKRQISIQHLLNMSAGIYWDEQFNDSLKKGTIEEAYDFILRQPLVNNPGEKFVYSSGYTQLLAAIVERATGMNIERFMAKHLFQPLGIQNYQWTVESNGLTSAWAGLRMRSRDMLKIGMLYLNGGNWNGNQIIPSKLVEASLISQVTTPYSDSVGTIGYSNQFWVYADKINGTLAHYAQAQGNGGQLIVIDKERKLVLVTTAGNYDKEPRKSSYGVYHDFIFPSIVKENQSFVTNHIMQLTYKAFNAELRKDTLTISNLMDDDFISVYPHKTQTKRQELAGIYKNIEMMKSNGHVIDSLYLDDFKLQLYDNTAISTYYSVTKGNIKGESFENRRTRWFDVWVRRNDNWKWVSSQGTEIKQ